MREMKKCKSRETSISIHTKDSSVLHKRNFPGYRIVVLADKNWRLPDRLKTVYMLNMSLKNLGIWNLMTLIIISSTTNLQIIGSPQPILMRSHLICYKIQHGQFKIIHAHLLIVICKRNLYLFRGGAVFTALIFIKLADWTRTKEWNRNALKMNQFQ